MNADFLDALKQIEKEKDIPMETLIETIESAIASAYKKAFSEAAEIRLRPDPNKKTLRLCCEKQVVETVVQEDADAVGLSLLSGAHMTLFPKVIEQLKEKGAEDVLVFGGGIIPDADILKLKEMGAAAIFTPGSSMASITDWLQQALEARTN